MMPLECQDIFGASTKRINVGGYQTQDEAEDGVSEYLKKHDIKGRVDRVRSACEDMLNSQRHIVSVVGIGIEMRIPTYCCQSETGNLAPSLYIKFVEKEEKA